MLDHRFNPWRGLVGLPRDTWLLAGVSLVNRMGTMVVPFLVLYLTGPRGFSATTAGVVLAAWGVTSVVAAPLAGWIADRVGAIPVMRVSLLGAGALLLVYPLATTLPEVIAVTVLVSACNEAFRPANLALMGQLVPTEKRRQGFALMRLAVNLGMSVGPALGGFLATVSFTWLFVVDGVTSLLAGIFLWLTLRPRPPVPPARTSSDGVAIAERSAWRDARFLVFLAALVPVAVVFFQHESAMPVFLVKHRGMSEATYGLMFTLNTLIIVLCEVPLNLATSSWTHRRILTVGALLCAAGFGALAFVHSPLQAMLTVLLWTAGEMVLFPGMSAYVSDVAPPSRQGQYMGLYTMAFGVAFSFGPALGTWLLDVYGGSVTWGAVFLMGATGALGFFLVAAPRRVTS